MKHTVYETKLDNGAKGLLINVPDASVMCFEINFRAGEYLVERDKWETPHLMEHILLGANEKFRKARKFQAEFEKNGAYCNASTSTYDIIYEAECADLEWDRILEMLNIAITKPLFLEDEFRAEFGNVKEELVSRSNSHFRTLSLALRDAFGFKVVSDKERLKLMPNVVIDDVRRHYKSTHLSSNMRFVIAGKLPTDRRKYIRRFLNDIELETGKDRFDLPKEQISSLKKPLFIEKTTVDNLYFYLDTFTKRRIREPELDALNLVNTMLTETLHSRILGSAREKGLVYGMSSGISYSNDISNWWFGAQVMPENIKALLEIMNRELNFVFDGRLKDEDITAAKQYALGRYQRSGQTVGGIVRGYSGAYFFEDRIDDYYKVPERIRVISKDRITQIVQDMFKENIWGIGFLGQSNQQLLNSLHKQVAPLWDQKTS